MTLPRIGFDEPQDSQTPLIHFTGNLKEYKINQRTYEGRQNPNYIVVFDFTDLTVIESREPYFFPTAQIQIPFSDRADTRWAAFTKSVRSIIPADQWANLSQPLDILVGKRVEFFLKAANLRLPVRDESGETIEGKWAVQLSEAWQLESLEGFTSAEGQVDIWDLVLEFANGKKETEIKAWVYNEPKLKSLPKFNDVVEATAEGNLLSSLVTAGKLTRDNEGTYHLA